MSNAILHLLLNLIVPLLQFFLDIDHRREDYVCDTCVCQGTCSGTSKRSGNLAPYESTYKPSYREFLGTHGLHKVERVLGRARVAVARREPKKACDLRRELNHLRPILERPELADTAMRREVDSLTEQLSDLCR